MISKFATVYRRPCRHAGSRPGRHARPTSGASPTTQLASVFDKTEAIARQMDQLGCDTLWLAEHHFQREGYEVHPEHPDAGRPSGASDQAAEDRLRLQHRADVASAAAGRGLSPAPTC